MPERESFIEAFLAATDGIGAPRIFRLWSALSTIAGALEQKVWIRSARGRTFPHLYVMLVGRPGVGKSIGLEYSRRLLSQIPDQFIAPTNVSRASMVDALSESERRIIMGQEEVKFHSLKAIISEFAVFLPAYETDFMAILTDFWNCYPFEERKRTAKTSIKMDSPQINILAGTTPSQLMLFLPEGAWEMGFMSRTHVIYSGEVVLTSLFDSRSNDAKAYDRAVSLINDIALRTGELLFERDAADAMDSWHMNGGKPLPDHPKLLNYNTRRTEHLLKLCMLSACDRGHATITIEDYSRAMTWLIEAENAITDVFHEMKAGSLDAAQEECYYYVFKAFMKESRPIVESRIVNFLRAKVASNLIMQTIEIMVRARMLKPTQLMGMTAYEPGEKD